MMHKAVVSVFFLITTSFAFGQASLVESLSKLGEDMDVSFSYDPDLIGDVVINEELRSVQDLSDLLTNSALRLEEISPNEYVIAPKKTEVQIAFKSKDDESALEPFYLDVVRGTREVLFQDFISNPQNPISFQWNPKPGDSISLVSTAYETIQLPVEELLIETSYRTSLTEKVTYLREVIIENYLSRGIELDVSNHTTSLKTDELALIPGETDGDILAAIATLPGINTPDSRPGNLFIRGSSTDQNFLLFNNIPIYHRGHYFGSISPYNPSVISEVKVHKNGFHPRMGGRVGGGIEIISQDSLKDYQSYGIGINTLYGNAFVRQKLSKDVGISLAARRSLPSSFSSPKLRAISDMVYAATALTDPQLEFDLNDIDVIYEDYNFNTVWTPGEQDWIKLSGLLTNNETNYLVDTDTTRAEELLKFGNDGLSAQWRHSFGGKLSSLVSGYHSSYQSTYERLNLNTRLNERRGDFSDNKLQDTQVSVELENNKGNWNRWDAGVSAQWINISYRNADVIPGISPVMVMGDDEASIYSAYGNYRFDKLGDLYFQVGGRGSYFTGTDKLFLSPRMLLNYDVGSNLILKSSAGRYFQFINQIKFLQFGNAGFDNELWRLADDNEIGVLHSDQYMIGGILTSGKWVLDLEIFRKKIANVNYSSTSRLQPSTTYANATWNVSGFDLFIKAQISNGLSLWSSYEYTQQHVTFDSLESISYNYKFNQPHRFKFGGLYQNGRWKVSFSYKVLSGLYGRSLDILSELDDLVIREVVNVNVMPPPGGGMQPPSRPMLISRPATIDDLPERYPTFSTFDLFVTYHLPETQKRKWSTTFGLSLINVFDNNNQIDQVVRGGDERNLLQRNAVGFSPNLNMTITW